MPIDSSYCATCIEQLLVFSCRCRSIGQSTQLHTRSTVGLNLHCVVKSHVIHHILSILSIKASSEPFETNFYFGTSSRRADKAAHYV
jgi:hypothetical protein